MTSTAISTYLLTCSNAIQLSVFRISNVVVFRISNAIRLFRFFIDNIYYLWFFVPISNVIQLFRFSYFKCDSAVFFVFQMQFSCLFSYFECDSAVLQTFFYTAQLGVTDFP